MSDKKSNTAVKVAIIAGLFTLCGTIVTVFGGPLVADWFQDDNQVVTEPPTSSSSGNEEEESDNQQPSASTINLRYMENESGWVTQGGQIGTGADHPPQAGDFNNNAVVRGFLSFDLTQIPNDVIINSAALILPDSAEGSGEVFPDFGALKFEALWYGLSLNSEAFNTQSYMVIQNSFGQSSIIGVTSAIEEALKQGYRRFQIRFSFALGTDNDDEGEVFWVPSDNNPVLEVEYLSP